MNTAIDEQSQTIELTPESRRRCLEANLDAIRGVAFGLPSGADHLASRLHERWLRHPDGRVVATTSAGEQRTVACADRAVTPSLDATEGLRGAPIYVHAAPSLALLAGVSQRRFEDVPGYRQPLFLIDAEPSRLLDLLSTRDASEELAQHAAFVGLGPEAGRELDAFLRSRLGFEIKGAIIDGEGRGAASLSETIGDVTREQRHHSARLDRELRRRYSVRGARWWADRFASPGTPLRCMILSVRFSSFIKHSCEDIAEGFRSCGFQTQIVIEPDDRTRLTTLARLQAAYDFDPDLILCINHTRAQLRGSAPGGPPFVCWIQDIMPGLSDPRTWAEQASRDFVVGHVLTQIAERFGFRAANSMKLSTPVSATKFRPAPAGRSGESRDCRADIAFVTNQSETPEAAKERWLLVADDKPRAREVVDHIDRAIVGILDDPSNTPKLARIVAATRAVAEDAGLPEPQRELCCSQIALPLAELRWRHQTLDWAIDLAEHHGYDVRVFGGGWGEHPRAHRYARGPLAHGEPLRDAYANATLTVHASIHGFYHQRVFETLLSGGFPAIRVAPDVINWVRDTAVARVLLKHGPDGHVVEHRWPFVACIDHPELCRLASMLQRLGRPANAGFVTIDPTGRCDLDTLRDEKELWALGEPDAFMFDSPEGLRALLERLGAAPLERRSRIASAASRVRDAVSYDAAARRIFERITRVLNADADGEDEAGPT